MTSVEAKPRVADPVSLEDVERELYALTEWQKPQVAIDAVLELVRRFANATRAGLTPLSRAPGHAAVRVVHCARAHLDEHTCQVEDAVAAPVELPATNGNAPCAAPAGCVVADGCPLGCTVARFEAAQRAADTTAAIAAELQQGVTLAGVVGELEPVEELTPVKRNEPALTIEQLLVREPESLRPAQRVARATLLAGEQPCAACGVVKPLDAFYRDNAKLTRRMSKCSECSNAASVARRAAKSAKPPGEPL